MSARYLDAQVFESHSPQPAQGLRSRPAGQEPRKGTNGVSTNGVTAKFMFLIKGLFGHSR